MTSWIVKAESDGYGYAKPFQRYNGNTEGARVTIGDRTYRCNSAGYFKIPKYIMEDYGIKGDDGRNRVQVTYSTPKNTENHWRHVKCIISTPADRFKNADDKQKVHASERRQLKPDDSGDYNWSP